MVRVLNTGAKFGGEEWVGRELGLGGMGRGTASGRTHVTAFATLEAKTVDLIGRQFLERIVPGPIGVTAEHGKHFARREHCSVPSRDCVERNIESSCDGQLLQFQDVRRALARALQSVLIFKLDSDYRPAVFP